MMEEETEHRALYRKWRPARFSEVVGQTYTVKTLVNALARGELAHAYLFAGPRGTGKTTVARLLAKAVNCLRPQGGEPCNACDSCRRIGRGASLDVVEIDGASNRGIDQIRRLREEVNFVPADSRCKVYVIDEVHMLTNEAFNALLKTLEEPPRRVIFIFATTEPHKLPQTVVSRCQAFEFTRIPSEQISAQLEKVCRAEGIQADERALHAIAGRAGGSLRDALVTLEQLAAYVGDGKIGEGALEEVLGLPPQATLEGFLTALLTRRADQALSVLAELSERGRDLELFLEELIRLSRDRLIQAVERRQPSASPAQLARLLEHLLRLKRELSRAHDVRVWLEVGALRFLHAYDTAEDATPTEPPSSAQAVGERTADPPRAEGEAVEHDPDPSPSPGARARSRSGSEAEAKEEATGAAPWQRLLEAVRRERIAVYAYLIEGTPVHVRGEGVLRVLYDPDHRFHKESLEKPAVRRFVEETVRQVYGDPNLKLEVAFTDADTDADAENSEGAKVSSPSPSPSPSSPSPSPPPSLVRQKAELVKKVLGGEIVE